MSVVNIGTPQVANRAFVALAVEAGIVQVIKTVIGLATDKISLLIALEEALSQSNPGLAAGLNIQTLDAILAYTNDLPNNPFVTADHLPKLLNENGPASTSAARDGGVNTQVNVTFSEPPNGYTYEIYLNSVLAKAGSLSGQSGFVNEAVSGVAAGAVTVRVLYVNPADGDITRFGQIVNIAS